MTDDSIFDRGTREIDFERAVTLLDVVQKCANVGVMYNSIAGLAGMELKAMNDQAVQIAKDIAEYQRQQELDRQQAEREAAEAGDAAPRSRPASIFPEGSGVKETPHQSGNPTVVERKV